MFILFLLFIDLQDVPESIWDGCGRPVIQQNGKLTWHFLAEEFANDPRNPALKSKGGASEAH